MQEITGAKPVRDAILAARGSRGKADPPDSESGSLGRASRLAPTISPSKHCQRCVRSVSEFSSVQLRVRAPITQSSQRSGEFHKLAVSGAAPETATTSASRQQPADFFCKEFLPEHHRLEAPLICSRSPMQRHDVESVASAGAIPVASTTLACKH